MVGTNGVALLAFWATLLPTTIRGANIVDPIAKRRLRHRQVEHQTTKAALAQREQNRAKRLGAAKDATALSLKARGLQEEEECVLQGNLYGNFEGNMRSVEFLYQGVFTEGTSQVQINLNILPDLEREIVTGILPAFFDCPGVDPTGLINGISPTDADSISVGGAYPFFVLYTCCHGTFASPHIQYWTQWTVKARWKVSATHSRGPYLCSANWPTSDRHNL